MQLTSGLGGKRLQKQIALALYKQYRIKKDPVDAGSFF
jgi:hypothetical protein